MADVEQQQGGASNSRRRKHTGKLKAWATNDWPRSGETRSRASPRSKRHGDIDMDIVESSDDANDAQASSKKQRPRRRRQLPSPTASDASSGTTAPAKTPQRSPKHQSKKSMRVPNASVPVLDTAPAPSHYRRPTCIIEEVDDDDALPSGPSRPVSRQTVSRRDLSPRSAHRYRSTPESRRSPRTSVSDSEDDTEATSDSDDEQVIPPRKTYLPPAPPAPPVPPAPAPPAPELRARRPDMVYEEDGDGTSRYAPSVARHRSLSRPASSKHDHYRRPRDITISGPPSLDETRSRSRSKSARQSRRHYESDVYVPSRPASSFKQLHAASSYSPSSSTKRSTFFGDFAAPSIRPSQLEQPVERTTVCALCRDGNTPVSKTVKLKCRHRMCHSCLRNIFERSLTAPQHMPPRCCTTDNIPTKYVDMLFDSGFKREWNQKYMEYTGGNRIVCPSRRCGELMKPEDMRREAGRWQGRCSRCRTKVCGLCSGRWHRQPECPRDDGATRFREEAKPERWRRCYRCHATLEAKNGRDHIVCRCGAESCLACGGKWKACECMSFRYDAFDMNTMKPGSNPFASRPGSPHDLRSDFGLSPAVNARQRPSSYEEDAYLRRLHEQRGEHLARRMHSFDAFGHHGSLADFDQTRKEHAFNDIRDARERRGRGDPQAYGAPFGDDDYHRRAATVVTPSPPQVHVPVAPPPPHSAFEPPSRPAFDRSASGFDYGAVNRGRGMRYTSPERYDDYVPEHYTPERRRPRSPDRWHPISEETRPRSRDRRHTFPSESRPTSPETWQQLPTRYPTPERPTPAPEEMRRAPSPERRRAPSPDRRRASSLERRLADRFKPESRQIPAGPTVPVGPVGTLGQVIPLGPLTPTRIPPPPSRAATHVGTGMPMAPVPPPAVHGPPPAVASLRRHHTMGEEVYAPVGVHGPGIPPADWFGPPLPHPPGRGMMHGHPAMHDMMDNINGGSPRAPNVRRRPPQAHREHNKYDVPRSSVLAGLGGMGRGMHRVPEWVNYVEPGLPDGDRTPAVVQ